MQKKVNQQIKYYFSERLKKAYLSLAQDSAGIGQLFELLKNSVADEDGINAMLELGKRHEKGVKMIRKAIISDKIPLTPREREIADGKLKYIT